MKSKTPLPTTQSVSELADFWDTHDLTDFDHQLEEVTEPVFERIKQCPIGDTTLIGRAKELEVAGMLIRNGIYVFWPLVDTGADLLATNRDASRCMPVQVRYAAKRSALGITRAEAKRFAKPNTVLAFVVGKGNKQHTWFLPFDEWKKKYVDTNRRDGRIYVRITENVQWLGQFEGDAGILRTFSQLLPPAA
ncbi:MAG TPA: hypothetical protein VFI31_28735 [Pirellulales bacterium]|nr:hypothetical protein [Pirellulales bacterium]